MDYQQYNDMDQLESLLERYSGQYQRIWLVTESVFSMDGDIAPLRELVALKKHYGAFLYVDEAHAIGCLGQKGLGLAESLGLIQNIDVLVGVFGKALAGVGAFVVANAVLIDSMINFSRSWLFSNLSSPPKARAGISTITCLGRVVRERHTALPTALTLILPAATRLRDSRGTGSSGPCPGEVSSSPYSSGSAVAAGKSLLMLSSS